MIDLVNGGRRQAVGGDIVLCECADSPRIVAVYGRRWMIHDEGKEKAAPVASAPAQRPAYDEQFTVRDATGRSLAGVRYRIRMGTDVIASGLTDSGGRTRRIATDSAKWLRLDVEVESEGV